MDHLTMAIFLFAEALVLAMLAVGILLYHAWWQEYDSHVVWAIVMGLLALVANSAARIQLQRHDEEN